MSKIPPYKTPPETPAPSAPARSRDRARTAGALLLLPLLLLAYLFTGLGFDKLTELRTLERTPRVEIANVIGGAVNLDGQAGSLDRTVVAPHSGRETLLYHATTERRTRDSEGRTRWEQIASEYAAVPFRLTDDSGSIAVMPNGAALDLNIVYQRVSGDLRYRERRIDDGDRLFAFGVAERRDGIWNVSFVAPGHYTPLLSHQDEATNRQGMALSSMLRTWLALAAFTGAVLAVCVLLRIHQTVVVLTLLTVGIVFGLAFWGWNAARMDLDIARQQVAETQRLAERAIGAELERHGLSWDGDWATLGGADGPTLGRLPAAEAERLARIRINLARAIERARETWRHRPERWVAAVEGWAPPAVLPLDAADREAMAAVESDYRPTRLSATTLAIALPLSILLAWLLPWLGFRTILVKRRIEAIPTSRSSGVAYGIAELKGTIEALPGSEPLVSPLSQTPCVHYRYRIEERRGSGRNARWVTVHSETDERRFLCRDADGVFPIDPDGADIIVTATTRSKGRQRHIESCLPVGGQLYALGHATIDPETQDSLYLTKGDGPFVLSTHDEARIVLGKARSGFLLLAAGFLAALALALALAGGIGAFSGLSYLTAATVGPVFLGTVLVALMYNDLVYLRQRVRTTWSNIDVALKKRADLLGNLEAVLRDYLVYERGVLEDLTRVRTLAAQPAQIDREQASDMMTAESRALDRLLALREAHPDLGSGTLAERLLETLIALENEVALMREGFNNAVERFNTLRDRVPETFLARQFGFTPEAYFQAPVEVRPVPKAAIR